MSVSGNSITTSRTLFARSGFPTLTFHRCGGEWWIASATLEETIFTSSISNRAIYKQLLDANNIPTAVADMLTKERRKVKSKVAKIRRAFTLEGFVALLAAFPVDDAVAWRINHLTTADVDDYIGYARSRLGPSKEKKQKSAIKKKLRESPPRKDAEREDDDDKPYIDVVRNLLDEKLQQQAVEQYMMMPHVEARAQEILAQQQEALRVQSNDLRAQAIVLMHEQVEKAVAEHMKTRAQELEGELKESVIQRLSQRADIMEQARNVALTSARAFAQKEKMQLPKRRKVHFEPEEEEEEDHGQMSPPLMPHGLVMPAVVTAEDMLLQFKKDYPNLS